MMAASPQAVVSDGLPEPEARVEELTIVEARQAFDQLVRRRLGISGEEFLRRWDAGDYSDDPDRPGLMETVLALPFVGR